MSRLALAALAALASLALLLGSACSGYASFSSHRSARLLAPGKQAMSAAVGYGHYEVLSDPIASDGFATEFFYRRGVTRAVELGGKLSHLRWYGNPEGDNTLVYFDGTIALFPDELALVLPLGLGFGEDGGNGVHHLQIQPGLVHTATLSPTLELDSSVRFILVSGNKLNEFGALSAAATVGVRVRSDAWRVELHPEIGLMVDDLTHRYPGNEEYPHDVGDSLTFGVSFGATFLP